MSEVEIETVEDTPELDIEETNTDESFDSSDSSDEITYEQAMEWKKKADRLEKAERTLVEQKRKLKEIEKQPQTSNEDAPMTRFDFEVEKFIDKNPEIAEYRDELVKYAKEKKLTLAQAKILVESEDKTIKNRQKITQSRVSD